MRRLCQYSYLISDHRQPANVPKVPHVPLLVTSDQEFTTQGFRFTSERVDIFVCHAIAFVEMREFRLLRRRDDEDAVALLGFEIEATADDAADPFCGRLARKILAEAAIEYVGDFFHGNAALGIGLGEEANDHEQLSFETGVALALQTIVQIRARRF